MILINPDDIVMTVSLNTPFTPGSPSVQITPNFSGNSMTPTYVGIDPIKVFNATAGTPVSVPGPIVGAGIPGLLSALGRGHHRLRQVENVGSRLVERHG